MKKFLAVFLVFFMAGALYAQTADDLFMQGRKMEQQGKDREALDLYKAAFKIAPSRPAILMKVVESSCYMGHAQTTDLYKAAHYKEALAYAREGYALIPQTAEANYALSIAMGQMVELEKNGDSLETYIRGVKQYADNAIAIDPAFARAYFALGKWNYEMATLNAIKRAAVKLFYRSVPASNLDSAITALQTATRLEPLFIPAAYYLAQAYKQKNKYQEAINTLTALQKMPVKNGYDRETKEAAKSLLASLN